MAMRPPCGHVVEDWQMTFPRITHVDATGSTNQDVLAMLDAEAWPHLSVLVADSQLAGRGRAGAQWVTSPGCALTCSVVIDPESVPQLPLTWLPLAVGLAVREAAAPWISSHLKWPNDVVADAPSPDPAWGWGPKIAGILCERHPSGAIVAGIGVNCLRAEFPVPWAASIEELAASAPLPRDLLPHLGEALAATLSQPLSGIRTEYQAASAVVGTDVTVAVPGGSTQRGRVRGFDHDGALLLNAPAGEVRITAGDARRIRRTNFM